MENQQCCKCGALERTIKVQVLPGGKMPSKAHQSDAGFDLYSTEDFVIRPGEVRKVPLGVRMELPAGTWGNVTSKSGLGSMGLLVYAGVIDRNYRGEIHAVITNLKHGPISGGYISIQKGMKLCQMLLSPHSEEYQMVQVDQIDENTDRGTGGFGSSGK